MPTNNLALPYIEAAQAQKHVTHNEALRLLDSLVQLAVLDRDLGVPPATPAEGARWIVKALPAPTGAWTGHGNHVTAWQDGAWQFSVPRIGWIAFVVDEGTLVTWNGAAWGDFFSTVTAIENLARLGIGTTADAANPLSAKLNNALWMAKTAAEGGDGDLRYKLSKETAADTLSLLMQTNFSGRAEIGLTGDDDLHMKVSADGSTWREALLVSRTTGKVSFPQGAVGLRERLTAARTYYVRTDGNDANSGLANTADGAFGTVQKAVDVIFGTLDLAGLAVTVQIADGTYTAGAVAASPQVGAGMITIQGNAAAPGNVIVSATEANCFAANSGAALTVNDLEVRTATAGGAFVGGLLASKGGVLAFNNVRFGTNISYHIRAEDGGRVLCSGNYEIVGNSPIHWNASAGGIIRAQVRTITLTGTPAFSTAFAHPIVGGFLIGNSNTFVGAATGKRYAAESNGVVHTGGASTTYLPGDVAGTTATGGQYG